MRLTTTLLLTILVARSEAWALQARPPQREESRQTVEEAALRRTVTTWLECEECNEGELEAIVKLGTPAVPSLVEALRAGPSQARQQEMRRHLIATYQRLNAYEKTHPGKRMILMTEEKYIQTYLDNFMAGYQVRAATALAAIGGMNARNALEEALNRPLRDDVKAAVRKSSEKLKKP